MSTFTVFHDIANNPHEYAKKWKEKSNQKVLGYFCTYAPEELIHAASALPFRIIGNNETIQRADAHLQAYCCSLVRSGLEDALSGQLSFLDGTVFPHTCDSIQRLSDIWRLNAGFPVHIDVILPVKLNTQSAQDYTIALFKKFRTDLENSLDVSITEEKLYETIRLYNSIRQHMMQLYEIRSKSPDVISGKDFHALIRASMVMDRNDLLDQLKILMKSLGNSKNVAQSGKKRLFLSGGICSHPDIYSILEEFGGTVVWDDLCTGSRCFSGEIDEKKEPVTAIANRYIERIVCPAKHSGLTSRGENLAKLAKAHHVDGVIFILLKFCDPHSFDYPYLKSYLDEEKIPSMLIEVEKKLTTDGQLKTRLESFVEIL